MKSALYLHSPFCIHKCGYCDFNSWGETRHEIFEQWYTAFKAQLSFWAEVYKKQNIEVDTIFFGGGTPSLLSPSILERIGQDIQSQFKLTSNYEWTLEANPETINPEKLKVIKDMGVNRLSVGIQSFQDRYLAKLERHAKRKDNLQALEYINAFWNLDWSLDLIFALPDQTLEDWLGEIDLALSFNPKHISAYELTLSTAQSLNWKKPGEDECLFFFNLTEERMREAGLRRYEVSNYAKAASECRHNLAYWTLKPFLGVGPGASGLLPASFLKNFSNYSRFGCHQKQVANFDAWKSKAGLFDYEKSILEERDARDHLHELLMMNLRLTEGVERARVLGFCDEIESAFLEWQTQGLVRVTPTHFQMAPRGLQILNTVLPIIFDEYDKLLDNKNELKQEVDPLFF